MSENNFDNYIKGLFDEDPEVPSSLAWEAMEFDLPKKTEEKKKQPWKRYLLLLLFLFMGSTIAYLSYQLNHLNDLKGASAIAENIPEEKATSTIKNNLNQEASTVTNTIQKENNKATQEIIQSSNKDVSVKKNSITDAVEFKKGRSKHLNQGNNQTTNSSNQIITNFFSKKDNVVTNNESNINGSISNDMNNEQNGSKVKSSTSSKNSIEPSTPSSLFQLTPPLDLIAIKEVATEQKDTPELTLASNEHVEDNDKKSVLQEIFVGYGYNTFKLKVSEANLLNDKLNLALGQSFSAGARLNINDHWKTNLQLRFDRYHSTFEHTRDLEPIINIQEAYKINRKEITYHNNYTNTLGLQLGLERVWKLPNQLHLYTSFVFTPTYILSTEGKTTTGTAVDLLTLNDQSKFSLNGGLKLGLMYPLTESVNIEMGYHFNKFFINEVFINNEVLTNQQNSISFLLAYRFGR